MSGPDPSPRLSTIPRERSRPSATASDRLKGRLRLLVVRHRLGRWATAGGAALLAAWTLTSAIADAESARAGWGEAVDVVVTRAALATGDVVTAGMVGIDSIPARVVPTNAVSALPLGARLTANVGPGEILVEHRLTRRSGSAASVAIPDGTRGVKLDREEVFGDVGDAVDLHALVSGHHLAQAIVVHADESSVTVAVPVPDVTAVVDAISQGGLVSVLVP